MASRPASANSFPSEISFGSVKLSHLSKLDIGSRIPGYRTSAAFFSSLRANLRLSESSPTPLPSPGPTPRGKYGKSRDNTTSIAFKSHVASNELAPPSPLILASTARASNDAMPLTSFRQTLSPSAMATSKSDSRPRSSLQPALSATSSLDIENIPEDATEPAPLLFWTTSGQDTDSALSLIAASVAEQRQLALRTLLLHPLNVFFFLLVFVLVQKSMFCVARYTSMKNKTAGRAPGSSSEDAAIWLKVCIVWAGLTLIYVALGHAFTRRYSRLARRIIDRGTRTSRSEAVHEKEKDPADADHWFKATRDEILVAVVPESSSADDKYNRASTSPKATGQCTQEREIIVGALVMSFVSGAAGGKLNKRRRSSGGRGYVRAWAVSPSWRRKGIGGSLLDEAARVVLKERGGDCVSFAENYAHADRTLPNFYNGPFDRRDRAAKCALQRSVETRPWMTNRRR